MWELVYVCMYFVQACCIYVCFHVYVWILCCGIADVIMDMLGVPKLRKVILDFYVVSFIGLTKFMCIHLDVLHC